jgi:hypothetical protein
MAVMATAVPFTGVSIIRTGFGLSGLILDLDLVHIFFLTDYSKRKENGKLLMRRVTRFLLLYIQYTAKK